MTETRVCRKCGRVLPVSAFPSDKFYGQRGRAYPRTTCRDCGRFQRANLRARPEPVKGQRRVCRVCNVEKPLAEYFMTTNGKRDTRCKACCARAVTERRRQRRATDPAWAAQFRARQAANERKRSLRRALARLAS